VNVVDDYFVGAFAEGEEMVPIFGEGEFYGGREELAFRVGSGS
jgi:hypothetical protein